MITETGKAILSKYLIGQSPSYASHIAIGCGSAPLSGAQEFDDYSDKKSMDFEMFRVPILSRGYVADQDGNTSVVLSAELPTEDRYEITEVGIFSSGTNPSAGSRDSKTLFSISREEGWEYHDQVSAREIPTVSKKLNENSDTDIDFQIQRSQSDPTLYTPTVFYANASNTVFELDPRVERNERCRFLDNMIMIRGDEGKISSGLNEYTPLSNHIHLTGISMPLDKNSPTDELKLAFSVINRLESAGDPDEVRIIVEFRSTESNASDTQVATMKEKITDFSSRYVVRTQQLQDLAKTINFTWSSIGVVKISACVVENGPASISIPNPTTPSDTTITSTAHGLVNGQTVSFSTTGSLPSGIDTDRWYFVINKTDDTFQISNTLGGAPVQTSGVQSGTQTYSVASDKWYVAIDGVRLENVSTINPLYGLTGYSVVRTADGLPVVKGSNTKGLVEFRFGVSIDGPVIS